MYVLTSWYYKKNSRDDSTLWERIVTEHIKRKILEKPYVNIEVGDIVAEISLPLYNSPKS